MVLSLCFRVQIWNTLDVYKRQLVDPLLAVRALLVYLAVQFIENQFIYPRVVGKSVGLSPLYTCLLYTSRCV